MADIALFGATGYTGRLTAHALAERGADFALVARDRDKLAQLASQVGEPQVHVASAGDVDALAGALRDAKVLITCVGPFVKLGDTAAEAALRAGVHYVDSTGEGTFIDRLVSRYMERSKDAGITLAPAMGFDEAPADLAATLAVEGIDDVDLVLTYALPRSASHGTIESALGIAASEGPWIQAGRRTSIRAGQHRRWAPLPQPLGPRPSISFPLAEARLAPLHLELNGLQTYVTAGRAQEAVLRGAQPLLRAAGGNRAVRNALRSAIGRLSSSGGPDEEARARSRFTILAEASAASGDAWRNVWLQGADPYGFTAVMLARAALTMAGDDYRCTGVLSPVQALGRDIVEEEVRKFGIDVQTSGRQKGDRWGPASTTRR